MTQRKTGIIGTLGSSCLEQDKIQQLLDAGVNIVRLNFAQGDHKVSLSLYQKFSVI